jgi:hypothetical protein
MDKSKITIWGREFNLNICYECYPGETILQGQKEAAEKFLSVIDAVEESKDEVEKYVLMSKEINMPNVDNIFKYVMPKNIYVPRNLKRRVVAIMCNYKFDIENGIAVVFENEHFKEIGVQDIVL